MNRIAITLIAALFATTASAEGFMPWTDVFAKADVNGDGGISMDEVKDHKLGEDITGFQPWMSDHFAALDTNGDGIVMMDELKAGMTTMKMDDEKLSRAFFEHQGFMPK